MSLEYNDENHTYEVKGKRLIGVTTLVHKYSSDFNKEEIIDKIFEKSYHPEIYLGSNGKYRFFTKEMISQLWKNKAEYGTFIHQLAEDIINNKEVLVKCPEVNQIKRFLKEGYEVIATELKVYSEELGVAGTIDLVLKKGDKYYIADWKTNVGKDLSDINGDRWTNYLKKPLNNTPDLPFWLYSLQTSVYQYILQNDVKYKDTYKEFGDNFLIHLTGSKDEQVYNMSKIDYKKINVPFMRQEVELMLEGLKNG